MVFPHVRQGKKEMGQNIMEKKKEMDERNKAVQSVWERKEKRKVGLHSHVSGREGSITELDGNDESDG